MSLLDTLKKNLSPEVFSAVQDALGDDFNYDVVPRSRLNKVIQQRDEARRQLNGAGTGGQGDDGDDGNGGAGSGNGGGHSPFEGISFHSIRYYRKSSENSRISRQSVISRGDCHAGSLLFQRS